jgi:hypothetical protein
MLIIVFFNPRHPWFFGMASLIVVVVYGWIMYELFFYMYDLEVYIKVHTIPAALAGFLGRKFFKHKYIK